MIWFVTPTALPSGLTVVEFASLRLSGISDLFGLWAELTMGLDGVGMLREPTVVLLGLRTDSRSSFRAAASPTPLGLRLGSADPGAPGPPNGETHISGKKDLLETNPNVEEVFPYRSQSVVSAGGTSRRSAEACGWRRKTEHRRMKTRWSACSFRS